MNFEYLFHWLRSAFNHGINRQVEDSIEIGPEVEFFLFWQVKEKDQEFKLFVVFRNIIGKAVRIKRPCSALLHRSLYGPHLS